MTNMTIEDLQKKDQDFNKSGFIAKVDNIFIMLHSAVMLGNLERVKHKLNENLIKRYQSIIDNLNSQNIRQMYDEINVKSTEILSISETDDKYVIQVLLISRYMDYLIHKDTKKLVSGNNNSRIEKRNYLTFTKIKEYQDEASARKCPGCGANINANFSGKCPYCGTTYDTANYDWILEDIEADS